MLGRRRTRYPSLDAFVASATPTKTSTNTPEQAGGVDWMKTGADPFVLPVARRRLCRSLLVSCPHHTSRPMQDSIHCNGPRMDKRTTGRVCNSLHCNDCL
jgi:hypothetical protein